MSISYLKKSRVKNDKSRDNTRFIIRITDEAAQKIAERMDDRDDQSGSDMQYQELSLDG